MNSYRQSLYVAIIRVAANILMVGALFFAMRRASRQISLPSEVTFCLYFFGLTFAIWILAWRLTKWVKRTWPAAEESLIHLPGLGETLVRWSVADNSDKCRISR